MVPEKFGQWHYFEVSFSSCTQGDWFAGNDPSHQQTGREVDAVNSHGARVGQHDGKSSAVESGNFYVG